MADGNGDSGSGQPGTPYSHDLESRVARLESDVSHIRSDIAEIKGILLRLAPRIDEIYGKLPFFATTTDIANLRTETMASIANLRTEMTASIAALKIEIEKRPTRRQNVMDIFTIVGLIGIVLAIGARLAH